MISQTKSTEGGYPMQFLDVSKYNKTTIRHMQKYFHPPQQQKYIRVLERLNRKLLKKFRGCFVGCQKHITTGNPTASLRTFGPPLRG